MRAGVNRISGGLIIAKYQTIIQKNPLFLGLSSLLGAENIFLGNKSASFTQKTCKKHVLRDLATTSLCPKAIFGL